jgi:hypothetical protein
MAKIFGTLYEDLNTPDFWRRHSTTIEALSLSEMMSGY